MHKFPVKLCINELHCRRRNVKYLSKRNSRNLSQLKSEILYKRPILHRLFGRLRRCDVRVNAT